MSEPRWVEVVRARDAPEAHLLKSVLEDAGVAALVEGELLQGVLGELPLGWSHAPRVLVAQCDVPRAREILGRRPGSGAARPTDPSGGHGSGGCLSCGGPLREEEETCRTCGWSYRSGGPEGGSE
jgi:hypothetical protein